ncbi:hypothetical protein HMI55_006973 [Coelomomyces lativittatus]|nr:hypothetical protein HMI55_006973 [Coelomomyces lativittatus]
MNLATSETVSPNSPTVSSSPSSPIIDPSLGEDEPRALITYCDESGIWPSVEKDFLLRLPIQKLMWKSIRGTKIIDTLQVRLKQFHESLLPRSALYSSATPMLHLYFLNCDFYLLLLCFSIYFQLFYTHSIGYRTISSCE